MRYKEGMDRRQQQISCGSTEEEISENSPARFIEVFVDSLNMQEPGFVRSTPAAAGRSPCDARDLVKLYLYGYLNGIWMCNRIVISKFIHRILHPASTAKNRLCSFTNIRWQNYTFIDTMQFGI